MESTSPQMSCCPPSVFRRARNYLLSSSRPGESMQVAKHHLSLTDSTFVTIRCAMECFLSPQQDTEPHERHVRMPSNATYGVEMCLWSKIKVILPLICMPT